jgi:S-(hydroxymethyl)glutathione dehydrogenase / alcohol dehydrogenase
VRDLLPGGADHVFDFVGLKLVAEEGLAMLGVGGGLYLVGVSKPDVDISLNIFGAIGGQKRVVGVNFGSTNAKRDIPMYAQLYLQGRMNLAHYFHRERRHDHSRGQQHDQNHHHSLHRWGVRRIPWPGGH